MIDLSKQQALDADSKAIQQIQTMQINFAGNQEWTEGGTMFFIVK